MLIQILRYACLVVVSLLRAYSQEHQNWFWPDWWSERSFSHYKPISRSTRTGSAQTGVENGHFLISGLPAGASKLALPRMGTEIFRITKLVARALESSLLRPGPDHYPDDDYDDYPATQPVTQPASHSQPHSPASGTQPSIFSKTNDFQIHSSFF